MVRPRLQLNEEQIRQLASIQCTMQEIASVMGCSVDTLDRRYAEIIKKGQEEGKSSLRRMQYKVAMGGNPSMLIWLGKQYLNQKDAAETPVSPETSKAFGSVLKQIGALQVKRAQTETTNINEEIMDSD